jgi:hypothetical protein
VFHTVGMKTDSSQNTGSRWQKTPVANLVRHVQSGNYYARIRVRGKLIWKSLKTNRISVAKLRLGDFHKEERHLRGQHSTSMALTVVFSEEPLSARAAPLSENGKTGPVSANNE